MRQIFTPNCVSWQTPTLHSASVLQSWRTGPLGAPAPVGAAHEALHVEVVGPEPSDETSRQHTWPAPQLAALAHVSAASPLHAPLATQLSVVPPPPPPVMQHSCVPAVHFDAPHAKVVPNGGVDVGEPVGEPVGDAVGDPVGEPVGEPLAIEGGVMVGPPAPGSAPAPGPAGSVGLVLEVVPPPMALPSVEPPHAATATTPASEAANNAVTEKEVFMGGASG